MLIHLYNKPLAPILRYYTSYIERTFEYNCSYLLTDLFSSHSLTFTYYIYNQLPLLYTKIYILYHLITNKYVLILTSILE